MSFTHNCVGKLYTSVIEDVISGVREHFMDEGVDEQVLMELKQTWENRLKTSRAVDLRPDQPDPHLPPLKNQSKPTTTSGMQQGGAELPKTAAITITLPGQSGVPDAPPRSINIQVPSSALQGNQLHTLLTGPVISATMALPQHLAAALLQQHITAALQGQAATVPIQTTSSHQIVANGSVNTEAANRQVFPQQQGGVPQVDGVRDSSDEEENEDEDNDDDDEEDEDEKEEEEEGETDLGGVDEEPLNSGDDVSEDDPAEMFETDNVVVCQYDKITRSRNKWKFYLKDGIMNLRGKDFVFQKSNGDAEW